MAQTENPQQTPEQEKQVPKFRGLYEHVHVSVRTLDIIIVACVAVILIVLAVDLGTNPGFTVSFDSKGGTDVAPQQIMYGNLIEPPEPPTREGYTFTGWFRDSACYEYWSMEVDKVEGDLTLYAGWKPNSQ